MPNFEDYMRIKEALCGIDRCEPKYDRFPFKPILCRRWWTAEHHRSCGNVAVKSLDNAHVFIDCLMDGFDEANFVGTNVTIRQQHSF